ncbi:hypothetical protein [Gluconobacter kanchanaburiensis]|uniref:Uncharacterized protein n=2 Tax=Gluconobacter kanchanaburiensis TaxID=563199 RepID=A0A511BDJ0_9PROT|nr:hypothetical protein [Gluconobacter kanchanaburiensis]GEK95877.1 hypothetical protein GKA01_10740 [Gluconobacter kanchanaburiensis NBRC 103587]
MALSPESAGNSLGVSWWLEITDRLAPLSILDCGDSPAIARHALDCGIGLVVCRLSPAQRRALNTYEQYRNRILLFRPPSSRPSNLRERPDDRM